MTVLATADPTIPSLRAPAVPTVPAVDDDDGDFDLQSQ